MNFKTYQRGTPQQNSFIMVKPAKCQIVISGLFYNGEFEQYIIDAETGQAKSSGVKYKLRADDQWISLVKFKQSPQERQC